MIQTSVFGADLSSDWCLKSYDSYLLCSEKLNSESLNNDFDDGRDVDDERVTCV